MPCNFPLTAYYSREIGSSGKRGITFERGASFSGVPIKLPCGQCTGCRLEHSRQWAMRCVHENMMHKESCFVTLTYDEKEMPRDGMLEPKEFQLFNKRLREAVKPFRFFACGEYGERRQRPHYHSCIFGLDFPDKRYYKCNERGEKLYHSAKLEKVWGKGLCVIGSVSFDSAAYVARYCVGAMKDRFGIASQVVNWSTGEIIDRVPEFQFMSKRPGIGFTWFQKYGVHAYKHDSVVMNGVEVRPPRYYETKYSVVNGPHLELIKKRRKWKASKRWADNRPDRRKVRETVTRAKLGLKRRDT